MDQKPQNTPDGTPPAGQGAPLDDQGVPTTALPGQPTVPQAPMTQPPYDAARVAAPSGNGNGMPYDARVQQPYGAPTAVQEPPPPAAQYPPYGQATTQFNPPPMQPVQPVAPAPVVVERRRHGTPIVGPLLLIGAGCLLLANTLGWVDWNVWGQLWKLWPLVLVAIGLDLLIGRRSSLLSLVIVVLLFAAGVGFLYYSGGFLGTGNVTSSTLSVPLNNATSADVTIDMGAGAMTVEGSERNDLASGTLEYYTSMQAPKISSTTSDSRAVLRIEQQGTGTNSNWVLWPTANDAGRLNWKINLTNQAPVNLRVETGASSATIDLSKTKVGDLRVNQGVGQVSVTMPENAGATNASISGGVGELDLYVPKGVGARITATAGLGGVTADQEFSKTGNVYTTPDYGSAQNKADVTISTGVGAVKLLYR